MAEQLICNQQVVGSTPTVGFRGGLSTDMKMGYCVLIEYGRIPEWPKGTDCKSAGDAFEGSNPIRVVCPQGYILIRIWDLSSAGRASALQAEGHRFEPYWSHFADMAQWQSS